MPDLPVDAALDHLETQALGTEPEIAFEPAPMCVT